MKNKHNNNRLPHRLVKLEQKQIKRMSELNIPDFETFAQSSKRQEQMFTRLDRLGVDTSEWENIKTCEPDYCGREGCSAGCYYGVREQRLNLIVNAFERISALDVPVCEVSIVHPNWTRPVGCLNEIPIKNAQQWNYRRLAELDKECLAIGSFEVCVNEELDGSEHWAGQIHEITAGPSKSELDKVLKIRSKKLPKGAKPIRVRPIENLGRQLGYALKRLVELRRAYINQRTGRQGQNHLPPCNEHWAEHDRWLLDIPVTARTIKYGYE